MNAAAIDDRPVLVARSRPLVMIGIILVSLCQFLDATIANVALPHMRAALGASVDTVSWVLTSFMIATAIATPVTGWLSDRIGSRNLFLLATAVFLASSALCGAATSLGAMVIFRAVQGVSAAFIGPLTQTTLFDINPPSKHAMSMAVFSMIVMVAPITGPAIGGYLTEYLSWRWIFYVNLPLGIPALLILWWGLPSRSIEKRRFDLFGFFSLAVALAAMQLALDRGQHKDWLDSWEIVIEAIIAISALWIFVIHTRRTPNPLFRRELFGNRPYLLALSFMLIVGIAVVGLASVLPMMFQSIYHYSVIDSGLVTAPRGLGVMVTSFLCGRLVTRMDYRWIIVTGFWIAAGGMWMMTRWSLEMDQMLVYQAIFIQGFGMGMIFAPMNLMAFSTLSPVLRPDGASLLSLFRSLGGSIGISIIVTMLARNQQVSHADLGAHVTSTTIPGFDWSGMLDRLGGSGAAAMAMIDAEVSRQAMMIAFLDDFVLLTWMLIVFSPLPFLLKRPVLTPASQGRLPVVE